MPTILYFDHPLTKLSSDEFDVKVGRVKKELDHFVSERLPTFRQAGFPAKNILQLVNVAVGRADAILAENTRRLASTQGREHDQMRDLDVIVSLSQISVFLESLRDAKEQIQQEFLAIPSQATISTLTDDKVIDLDEIQAQDHSQGGMAETENEDDGGGLFSLPEDTPKTTGSANNSPLSKVHDGYALTSVNPPPILVEQIRPDEEWLEVWSKLVESGFRRVNGTGLMDECTIFPGRTLKGGKEGIDYFCSERDLQEYCSEKYGWDMEGYLQRLEDKWSPYDATRPAVLVTSTQPDKPMKSNKHSRKAKTKSSEKSKIKLGKQIKKTPKKAKVSSMKWRKDIRLLASPNANLSKVTSQRIQSLSKSPKSPRAWLSKYYELLRFKDEHGDCLVPPSSSPLGEWVRLQRQRYGGTKGQAHNPLSQGEIQKLDGLGFVWSGAEATKLQQDKDWNKRFDELLDYKEKHGHFEVQFSSVQHDPLYRWANWQRYKHSMGELDDARVEMLKAVGFRLV